MKKRPKGTLIPMGGGVDKEKKKTIMCRLLDETQRRKPKICVVTVATIEPDKEATAYRDCFKSLHKNEFSVVHFTQRSGANDPKHLEKVRKADLVILGGGDQLRLSNLMGGTALMNLLMERYLNDNKFVLAGSSAGATAMSGTMIIAGDGDRSLIKGELELTSGLNFTDTVFIDTHFTERGRVGRLIQTVTHNPALLGIGLGEDTGAIIKAGDKLEVIGSGLMVVVDGHEISYTN
ncbi:MAG TPA: cyanophycinase, partial [Flavobacteriales bacterium]|nr:cyanophycinase [Flavobacteriales bacterium]